MPDNTNRYSYNIGKGSMIRLLFRTTPSAGNGTLLVIPATSISVEHDKDNHDLTEGDSIGRFMAPGLENNSIRVDLRKRTGPISISAMGVRDLVLVECIFVDDGSGYGDWFLHMTPANYSRANQQTQPVAEGFTLIGGLLYQKGVAIPAWAKATEGAGGMPNVNGYIRTGVSIPTAGTLNI